MNLNKGYCYFCGNNLIIIKFLCKAKTHVQIIQKFIEIIFRFLNISKIITMIKVDIFILERVLGMIVIEPLSRLRYDMYVYLHD